MILFWISLIITHVWENQCTKGSFAHGACHRSHKPGLCCPQWLSCLVEKIRDSFEWVFSCIILEVTIFNILESLAEQNVYVESCIRSYCLGMVEGFFLNTTFVQTSGSFWGVSYFHSFLLWQCVLNLDIYFTSSKVIFLFLSILYKQFWVLLLILIGFMIALVMLWLFFSPPTLYGWLLIIFFNLNLKMCIANICKHPKPFLLY